MNLPQIKLKRSHLISRTGAGAKSARACFISQKITNKEIKTKRTTITAYAAAREKSIVVREVRFTM
jgi:hypothetical protein